ncbi:MAG TPA: serine/threonine-protein kinase [Candidatus Angelobacter sp.]
MDKTDRWKRMKELFGAALERDPGERSAFLREACGQDDDLRREVESLLSAHEQPNDLSQHAWTQAALEGPTAPKTIGPYELINKLGEGGMGQVWLAQQTAPVKRQVALKLIRAGAFSSSLLQRFQHERQSLAVMDHPSIAKVFEAGSTPEGQPYLVMEYVPGLPITEYCDEKKLSIPARLKLFMKVCDAVQHAHQKAVIHRDLKPANILVVDVDRKPVPRIIDFGLAKAAEPEAREEVTLVTQPGVFLGTPGYMSPEQADPDARGVDTRTDVYSLGVVLYVLLTGFLPFDAKQKPLHEILRQLREDDPPRPSTRISSGKDRETSSSSAAVRGTDPAQLTNLLKGDLDWIAMKALERDRARRYGTPQELAADISRYLEHEPVVARPASAGYRLRKYVRRHRIGVSVAGGLVLLLAGFATVQGVQLRRITRERDRADRVTQFMTGMFKVSDPSEARGNSITAREILDKSSKEIDTGLAKDPELQADMMDVMGNVYGNLGLYGRAQELLTRAVDVRTRTLGPENPKTMGSRVALGVNLSRSGRYAEAEKMLREAHALQSRVLGREHPQTLMSANDLSAVLMLDGHYVEAEQLQRETLESHRRVLGPEHPRTLIAMLNLGLTLYRLGRYDEAERLERETLGAEQRVLGPEHPYTLATMVNLAQTLQNQGRYPEAEKLQRETLAIQLRILGPEHPTTLTTMGNIGLSLLNEQRYSEAEKLLQDTLEIQRRVLGAQHPLNAEVVYNLACAQARLGKLPEALDSLREAIDGGLAPGVALQIGKDEDLASLHGNPNFQALVAHAKEQAAAAQKPK